MSATTSRCHAADLVDLAPCEGVLDVVRIVIGFGGETTACVEHGARLYAATPEARVYPAPGHEDKQEAIEVYNRAQRYRAEVLIEGAEALAAEVGGAEALPADVTTMTAREALMSALTGEGALDKQTAAELARQYMVVITTDRRERLVEAESDLLDIRGVLAPNGRPRRVPMELGERVAPAVEWLTARVAELERRPSRAEAARLREELERQTALAEQGARANRELSRLRRELGEMREREAAGADQLAAAVGRASSAVWPDLIAAVTKLAARPTRADVLREAADATVAWLVKKAGEEQAAAQRQEERGATARARGLRERAALIGALADKVSRGAVRVLLDASPPRPTRAEVLRETAQVLEDSEHLLAADELREMAAEAGKVTGRPAGGITRPVGPRWGLDDMELGDDGSVTLSGPGGEPYVLDLAPERAMALGLPITEHAAPYTQATTDTSDDDAATHHCGHDDYHDGHPWHTRPHTWCPGTSDDTERGEGRG